MNRRSFVARALAFLGLAGVAGCNHKPEKVVRMGSGRRGKTLHDGELAPPEVLYCLCIHDDDLPLPEYLVCVTASGGTGWSHDISEAMWFRFRGFAEWFARNTNGIPPHARVVRVPRYVALEREPA